MPPDAPARHVLQVVNQFDNIVSFIVFVIASVALLVVLFLTGYVMRRHRIAHKMLALLTLGFTSMLWGAMGSRIPFPATVQILLLTVEMAGALLFLGTLFYALHHMRHPR